MYKWASPTGVFKEAAAAQWPSLEQHWEDCSALSRIPASGDELAAVTIGSMSARARLSP